MTARITKAELAEAKDILEKVEAHPVFARLSEKVQNALLIAVAIKTLNNIEVSDSDGAF